MQKNVRRLVEYCLSLTPAERLLPGQAATKVINVGRFSCRVLDLNTLIAAKRFAGRDKDLLGLRHLEAIKKALEENPGLFDPPSSPDPT